MLTVLKMLENDRKFFSKVFPKKIMHVTSLVVVALVLTACSYGSQDNANTGTGAKMKSATEVN